MKHEHKYKSSIRYQDYPHTAFGPCKNCGLKEEYWDKLPECPAKSGSEEKKDGEN